MTRPPTIARYLIIYRIGVLVLLSAKPLLPQQPFANQCAGCHGEDARGTAKAPGLAMNPRVAEQSVEQLRAYLERGNSAAGMPSFADLSSDDLWSLARYLLSINVETIVAPVPAVEPTRKTVWSAPQPGDWRTYNGNDSANRYSPLQQITTANVPNIAATPAAADTITVSAGTISVPN